MNRVNFEKIAKEYNATVSDRDWDLVSFIWNHHPLLATTNGYDDKVCILRMLFAFGSYALLEEMLPRAEHYLTIKDKISDLQGSITEANAEINMLSDSLSNIRQRYQHRPSKYGSES